MSGEVKLTAASGGGSISIKGPSSSGSDVDLLDTSGNLAISGTSTLTGNVTAAGTLAVTGTSTLTGNVTASGDVGLGTAPDNIGSYRTLHIKGPSNEGAGIRLQDNADTADSDDFQIYKNSSSAYLRVNGSDPLITYMNGAERMRVKSDGKVGIGTGGNPDQLFHIQDSSSTPIFQISSSGYHSFIGTVQSADNISNGTAAGQLHLRGQSGFSISANGGSATQLHITNTGRIAVPSTYSDAGTSMRDVQVESNGNYCGQSSIRAAKKNITELTDVSWIYDLKPVSFNYRKRTEDSEGVVTWLEDTESEKAHGLIAEDVEAVNKDFVFYNKDKDGNDVLAGVYYKPLISPLLKAIKDLKSEVDTLKTKVATLEAG
jgi:hypothetical protein